MLHSKLQGSSIFLGKSLKGGILFPITIIELTRWIMFVYELIKLDLLLL